MNDSDEMPCRDATFDLRRRPTQMSSPGARNEAGQKYKNNTFQIWLKSAHYESHQIIDI